MFVCSPHFSSHEQWGGNSILFCVLRRRALIASFEGTLPDSRISPSITRAGVMRTFADGNLSISVTFSTGMLTCSSNKASWVAVASLLHFSQPGPYTCIVFMRGF